MKKVIALNLTGNVTDAEDSIQEAFMKLYCSLRNFHGYIKISIWIYKILANTCHDLARKHCLQGQAQEVFRNSGGHA